MACRLSGVPVAFSWKESFIQTEKRAVASAFKLTPTTLTERRDARPAGPCGAKWQDRVKAPSPSIAHATRRSTPSPISCGGPVGRQDRLGKTCR